MLLLRYCARKVLDRLIKFVLFTAMGGGGGGRGRGRLAANFDLAAFWKDMIAPVKKSVNHSKTVTSMRGMRRIRATLSVETRAWKTQSYSVIVHLLLACCWLFCGSTKLNITINQDR